MKIEIVVIALLAFTKHQLFRMRNIFLALLIAAFSVNAFSQDAQKFDVQIESVVVLDSLPSGSGVVCYNQKNFIIGDDSPWLYSYQNDSIIKEKLISSEKYFLAGRVDKSQKLDFEDIDVIPFNGEDHLFILCSGSKKVYRDTLFVVNPQANYQVVAKKNMRPLYDAITAQAELKYINIEGITATEKYIILAHRGNNDKNILVKIKKKAFYTYLNGSTLSPPKFDLEVIDLPTSDGLSAGFSSLFYIKELGVILFTASLEGALDVYSDGEVFGSYVGMIPLNETNELVYALLKNKSGVFPTKLEGITVLVLDKTKRQIEALAVSDNDDGKTEVLELSISY